MQVQRSRLRNKLMLACALIAAGVLAAPGAFARSHDNYRGYSGYGYSGYRGHDRDHHGNAVAALVAGAVIGGLLVNAIDQSHQTYYSQPTYYAPPQPQYYPGASYGNDGYYNDGNYNGNGYYGGSYYDNSYYNASPQYYDDDNGY